MLTPINPQSEEIRAQAILSSLTDHKKAVNLLAPQADKTEPAANANGSNGRSIMRLFKAIRLNRRPAVDDSVQQPAYSPRQVTLAAHSDSVQR